MHDDHTKRKEIGARFIGGVGYEIGAGASPSAYARMQRVTFLDKRGKHELEQLFKAEIAYEVRSVDEKHPPGDFVIAHHVVEHAADPIGTIARWSSLVWVGGRMFLSLPAEDHACEKDRLPTPFEHILDDHLFERGPDHFDSKQHIPHFINQWTAMDPKSFWYAEKNVEQFVSVSLSEVRRNENDLHWHTYSLDVFKQVITAAFWFAGHGVEFIHAEHCGGMLYVVAGKLEKPVTMPGFLQTHHARLVRAAGMLMPINSSH